MRPQIVLWRYPRASNCSLCVRYNRYRPLNAEHRIFPCSQYCGYNHERSTSANAAAFSTTTVSHSRSIGLARSSDTLDEGPSLFPSYDESGKDAPERKRYARGRENMEKSRRHSDTEDPMVAKSTRSDNVASGIDTEASQSRSLESEISDYEKAEEDDASTTSTITGPGTYPITFNHATVVAMTQVLRTLRKGGLPERVELSPRNEQRQRQPFKRKGRRLISQLEALSQEYLKNGQPRISKQKYQQILTEERCKLPIKATHVYDKLMRAIDGNDIMILVSQTGSGKSTQLPQDILARMIKQGKGAFCNIACTQPRRIAATALARRVAYEQQTPLGKEGHVGFNVRFNAQTPALQGSITYMTAGVLLKALYQGQHDVLGTYSHIILDEVHERDSQIDMILTILRDIMRQRKAVHQSMPKIILMSATIDAADFKQYFDEPFRGGTLTTEIVQVPGRNHGIQSYTLEHILPMLEDAGLDDHEHQLRQSAVPFFTQEADFIVARDRERSLNVLDPNSTKKVRKPSAPVEKPTLKDLEVDLSASDGFIALTIALVLKQATDHYGDVLVFLPGIADIDHIQEVLQEREIFGLDFKDDQKFQIYKLHASLHETNDHVFDDVPEGCRRIVLATNIAQTSITLPDVTHVIDTGRHKVMMYKAATRTSQFFPQWIDKSAVEQRKGRAGRTRPGFYWGLYTGDRLESLDAKPVPGIRLESLTPFALAAKTYKTKQPVADFFSRMIDPPNQQAVAAAVKELKQLRMLTSKEAITPLGHFASWLPLEPSVARALLIGTLFRCLDPFLIMASHSADRPLINAVSRPEIAKGTLSFTEFADDDRFPFVTAFQQYNDAVERHSASDMIDLQGRCVRHAAYNEMCNVARQVCDLLSDFNIIPPSPQLTSEPRFPRIPQYLNIYSTVAAFVKPLTMSMSHLNFAVFDKRTECWFAGDTRVMIRPNSVNAQEKLRKLGRQYYLRGHGETMAYGAVTRMPSAVDRPWMLETSNVTPLTAMLFGGPVEIIGHDVIEISGWLRFQVRKLATGRTATGPELDAEGVAQLILELRRALDRFLQLACLQLINKQDEPQTAAAGSKSEPLFAENAPLTDALARDLCTVLELDYRHWDEYLHISPDAVHESAQRMVRRDIENYHPVNLPS